MAANRTTEYAVRALVVLALEGGQGRVRQAAELARHSGTPPKFLEQVLRILGKGGLVRSRRGPGGGYELARPAGRITMAEVLQLIQGEPEPAAPRGDPLRLEWSGLMARAEQSARTVLEEETLAAFADRVRLRRVQSQRGNEYQI